jgi:hypothetical protein
MSARHARPTKVRAGSKRDRARRLSHRELDGMIGEATFDAYSESEQAGGFFTMLEDNLALPFETIVLGVEVAVEKLDITDCDEIVAVCRRGRARQTIPILDLPLPDPPPPGWKWIETYRYWARGGGSQTY